MEDKKKELKLFQIAFLIFMIGQIVLIISTLNFATSINGVPRFFRYFKYLKYLTYLSYFGALFIIRPLNQSFRYCFYSIIIFAVTHFIQLLCETSTNQFYVALGKGLDWSVDILLCIFYLLFFHGCFLFFDAHNLKTGKKNAYFVLITFLVLFISSKVFAYLAGTRTIMKLAFFNRFFLYGSWGFEFLIYTFTSIMVFRAMRYIHIKVKEGVFLTNGTSDEARKQDEELPS